MPPVGDGVGDDDDEDDDDNGDDDHRGRAETLKGAGREGRRRMASEDETLGVTGHLNGL